MFYLGGLVDVKVCEDAYLYKIKLWHFEVWEYCYVFVFSKELNLSGSDGNLVSHRIQLSGGEVFTPSPRPCVRPCVHASVRPCAINEEPQRTASSDGTSCFSYKNEFI